jgi:hypothetical protein
LLSNVNEFFLGEDPGFRDLMRFAIRFAHGGPDTHRHTSEPVLLGHHFLLLKRLPSYCAILALPTVKWLRRVVVAGL